jgi:hypothetical protein
VATGLSEDEIRRRVENELAVVSAGRKLEGAEK